MNYFLFVSISFFLFSNFLFAQDQGIKFISYKPYIVVNKKNEKNQHFEKVIHQDNILKYTEKMNYEQAKNVMNHYVTSINYNDLGELKPLEVISKLLEVHPDLLKFRFFNGSNFLFYAQSPEVVDILLDGGFSLKSTDSSRKTPLHSALEKQYSEDTILRLIERGADVTSLDKSLNSPLHFALNSHYSLKLIKALIPKKGLVYKYRLGKDVVEVDFMKGFFKDVYTPDRKQLNISYERVKWLLETYPKYLNYEKFNKEGNTLLHLSLDLKTAKLLTDKYKLSPLVYNKKGFSPVDNLTESYTEDKLILDSVEENSFVGINSAENQVYQREVLILKQITDTYLELIAMYIKKEKNLINSKSNQGYTALHRALHPKIILHLLKLGFDMSIEGEKKQNPLHFITSHSPDKDLVKNLEILLDHDVEKFEKAFNQKDTRGISPKEIFQAVNEEEYERFQKKLLVAKSAAHKGANVLKMRMNQGSRSLIPTGKGKKVK